MSTLIQRTFSRGELTPSLYQRVDLTAYTTGLRTCRNGHIKKTGGFENRAGTTKVFGNGTGETIGAATELVPWEANSGIDSYVLEFGNGFMRVVKNGELVRVSGVTAWSNATAYEIGDLAVDAGVNYYCVQAHTNHQPPNSTYWYALTGDVFSIPTPWTTAYISAGLSFVHRSDYMTICSRKNDAVNSLVPYDLRRTSDTGWTLTHWGQQGFTGAYLGPKVTAPSGLSASGAGSAATWAVATVASNGDETYYAFVSGAAPSGGAPNTLTWTAATIFPPFTGTVTVKGYNVYRFIYDIPYFLSFVTSTTFIDNTFLLPSVDGKTALDPSSRFIYVAGQQVANGVQAQGVVGSYQQRTLVGNFSLDTQTAMASKIGSDQNFSGRYFASDDDSIIIQLRGKGVNGIRHFLDIGPLLILTENGEWVVDSGPSGFLPSTSVPKQYGYNGASTVNPVLVEDEALYVQNYGSLVRAIRFDNQYGGRDGFKDTDLTLFSNHLFEGYEITSMAYQKTPNSVVWCVRDDGKMVGLTYIREEQIQAWHVHDTDGTIEKICSVPEGNEHALYMIVKRNINGSDVRYLERMANRAIDDIKDSVFLDCSLSYDGRNTGSTTMKLSGGTTWDYTETLTLTASSSYFVSGDVGNEIHLTGADGIVYRCVIAAYTSVTVVSVIPVQTIATASLLRTTATTTWAKAVDTVSGLSHLEGEDVSVFADGYVVANPNNSQYTVKTVSSGSISLGECYTVIHVGLPYTSDLETLDIDAPNGESLIGKKKFVGKVSLHVQNTRGLWIGPEPPSDDDTNPLEGLTELKIRDNEDYGSPVSLTTNVVDVVIQGHWSDGGRVFIRQVDPLPCIINSVAPQGLFPFRG